MKVEIKEGGIVIDPFELLSEMKGEDKIDLIESLSCQDEVIKHVSDQIIHGCTERGWWGSQAISETPSTPLDKAIRDVANNSSEVAKKEIERLERLVKSERELTQKGWDQYHNLRKEMHRYTG